MHIYRHLDELPDSFPPCVATIGNFDGVHRGHVWVIGNVLERARERGLRSLVITFDPHPSRAIRPEASPPLITPLDQKLALLESTGVDDVVVLPFTGELSRMSARRFAHDVLCAKLNVAELHEGENFRFGFQAEADIDALRTLAAECGFDVCSYAPQILRQGPVSSTRIRQLISRGEVSRARALLGRPFRIRSTPASGRGYGTRYAVPTINLAPYAELLPANGVYITQLQIGAGAEAETFDAVTNVGNRPTFGADSFTVESHLLRFHPIPLTEETPLELCFLRRLRDEKRFASPEDLLAQIHRDVATAERYFGLLHHGEPQPPVRASAILG